MTAMANVLSSAYTLAAPFWDMRKRPAAFLLLAVIVALDLGLVAIAVLLTYWQRAFFNSLEDRDWEAFINLLTTWDASGDAWMPGFGPILVFYVLFTVYLLYLKQALQIRWRQWMTHDFVDRWMADRHYYVSGLGIGRTENADQRIAEDIDLFIDGTLTLGLGLLSSLVSVVSFIVLLWSLSETIVVFGVAVPGYLVWLALLYAGAGTLGTHLFGRRLIGLNFDRQKAEADFRYGLIQVRDNAESVAFHAGEDNEKRNLSGLFGVVTANWRNIMTVTKRMTFFTSAYNQAALVFPLAISAPAYFAGRIPLGGIFQTAGAFVQVQVALSWFVDNYAKIAEWTATIRRLRGFVEAQREAARHTAGVKLERGGTGLEAGGLSVRLPQGRPVVDEADIRVDPGDKVLITGPSGVGKSVFLRAIAGIWPHASGRMRQPDGRFMILPQKPYMPTGTLARAIAYPDEETTFSAETVRHALGTVGLGHLGEELDRADTWRDRLSGGELQRLALAKAILQQPDWLILDEATAHLDDAWEQRVYDIIETELERTTIIAVAHRQTAIPRHTRFFTLNDRRIVETASPPGSSQG